MKYYIKIERPDRDPLLNGFDTYQEAERVRQKVIDNEPATTVGVVFEESDDYIDRIVPRAKMILATREGDVEIYDDGTQKPIY